MQRSDETILVQPRVSLVALTFRALCEVQAWSLGRCALSAAQLQARGHFRQIMATSRTFHDCLRLRISYRCSSSVVSPLVVNDSTSAPLFVPEKLV